VIRLILFFQVRR